MYMTFPIQLVHYMSSKLRIRVNQEANKEVSNLITNTEGMFTIPESHFSYEYHKFIIAEYATGQGNVNAKITKES